MGRRERALALLALVVFVGGTLVLPLLHNVGHSHDHDHGVTTASDGRSLTDLLFGQAHLTLPRLVHTPDRQSEEELTIERLLAVSQTVEASGHDHTRPDRHDEEEPESPTDHGEDSPLHFKVAIGTHHTTPSLQALALVRLAEPAGLTAQLASIDTLDLTQARAPPV